MLAFVTVWARSGWAIPEWDEDPEDPSITPYTTKQHWTLELVNALPRIVAEELTKCDAMIKEDSVIVIPQTLPSHASGILAIWVKIDVPETCVSQAVSSRHLALAVRLRFKNFYSSHVNLMDGLYPDIELTVNKVKMAGCAIDRDGNHLSTF
jgi:hypothetical protein